MGFKGYQFEANRKKSVGIQDFKLISCLGRGGFGKVIVKMDRI